MTKLNFLNMTNTYSFIAYDSRSKQIGGAMQTHVFEGCNDVIWAKPGVGVVATQGETDVSYAFKGLEKMSNGISAVIALEELVKNNMLSPYHQVGMIDTKGSIGAHTGKLCIGEAGHNVGINYSCHANIMLKNTVWDAMAKAFENSQGEFVERIMCAMEAAQKEGGDLRGTQAAAIKIVSAEIQNNPWDGIIYDFKVYDNPQPLKALRKLIDTKKIHGKVNMALGLLSEEKLSVRLIEIAVKKFNEAVLQLPDIDSKLQYKSYFGLTLCSIGQIDVGCKMLKEVFSINPVWKEFAIRTSIVRPELNSSIMNIILNL